MEHLWRLATEEEIRVGYVTWFDTGEHVDPIFHHENPRWENGIPMTYASTQEIIDFTARLLTGRERAKEIENDVGQNQDLYPDHPYNTMPGQYYATSKVNPGYIPPEEYLYAQLPRWMSKMHDGKTPRGDIDWSYHGANAYFIEMASKNSEPWLRGLNATILLVKAEPQFTRFDENMVLAPIGWNTIVGKIAISRGISVNNVEVVPAHRVRNPGHYLKEQLYDDETQQVIASAIESGEATLYDALRDYLYYDPHFSPDIIPLSELRYNSEIGLHRIR